MPNMQQQTYTINAAMTQAEREEPPEKQDWSIGRAPEAAPVGVDDHGPGIGQQLERQLQLQQGVQP